MTSSKIIYGIPCIICSEKRAINYCHIIPSSQGGNVESGNIIYLCPTHHFLFDHARLNKDEFDKIQTDTLHQKAKEYLQTVHFPRHQMRWKYQTNRFRGCKCGSKEFEFICHRDKMFVDIVLECKQCHEIWHNVWENNHPIHQLTKDVWGLGLSDEEAQHILDEAEEKIHWFLAHELKNVLANSNY
ncbi:MAG: HNH endonuclease [Bacteroidota bacterium]